MHENGERGMLQNRTFVRANIQSCTQHGPSCLWTATDFSGERCVLGSHIGPFLLRLSLMSTEDRQICEQSNFGFEYLRRMFNPHVCCMLRQRHALRAARR